MNPKAGWSRWVKTLITSYDITELITPAVGLNSTPYCLLNSFTIRSNYSYTVLKQLWPLLCIIWLNLSFDYCKVIPSRSWKARMITAEKSILAGLLAYRLVQSSFTSFWQKNERYSFNDFELKLADYIVETSCPGV